MNSFSLRSEKIIIILIVVVHAQYFYLFLFRMHTMIIITSASARAAINSTLTTAATGAAMDDDCPVVGGTILAVGLILVAIVALLVVLVLLSCDLHIDASKELISTGHDESNDMTAREYGTMGEVFIQACIMETNWSEDMFLKLVILLLYVIFESAFSSQTILSSVI